MQEATVCTYLNPPLPLFFLPSLPPLFTFSLHFSHKFPLCLFLSLLISSLVSPSFGSITFFFSCIFGFVLHFSFHYDNASKLIHFGVLGVWVQFWVCWVWFLGSLNSPAMNGLSRKCCLLSSDCIFFYLGVFLVESVMFFVLLFQYQSFRLLVLLGYVSNWEVKGSFLSFDLFYKWTPFNLLNVFSSFVNFEAWKVILWFMHW